MGRFFQRPDVSSGSITMTSGVLIVLKLLLILVTEGQMPAIGIFLVPPINRSSVV